jgi:hypothetical protein
MRFLPPRRWFQFRLSTWFVLVAILGWAMTCWPILVRERRVVSAAEWNAASGKMPKENLEREVKYHELLAARRQNHPVTWHYFVVESRPNARLLYPALALAAFLVWKAAWAMVARRRRRSAAPE